MSGKKSNIHVVTDAESTMRVDRWARKHFKSLPLSAIYRMIREGQLRVNGHKIKGDYRLVIGDKLQLPEVKNLQSQPLKHTSTEILSDSDRQRVAKMIVKDLDSCVVLNKPYGVSSQGGVKVNLSLDKLLPLVDEKLGIDTGAATGCRLVHRLDKETSGLMVVAKDRRAAEFLSEQFREGTVRKTYIAVVWGKTPAKGVIKNDLQDTKGEKQQAVTQFERKFVGEVNGQVVSIVAVTPKTGRKHQIRKHFLAIKHPLVGDKKYILPEYKLLDRGLKLQLCAHMLGFEQEREKRVTFLTDLPTHMSSLCKVMGCDVTRLLKR